MSSEPLGYLNGKGQSRLQNVSQEHHYLIIARSQPGFVLSFSLRTWYRPRA
jgi:hypothetical protein